VKQYNLNGNTKSKDNAIFNPGGNPINKLSLKKLKLVLKLFKGALYHSKKNLLHLRNLISIDVTGNKRI